MRRDGRVVDGGGLEFCVAPRYVQSLIVAACKSFCLKVLTGFF